MCALCHISIRVVFFGLEFSDLLCVKALCFLRNSQSFYLNMPILAEMSCILVILTFTIMTPPTDK